MVLECGYVVIELQMPSAVKAGFPVCVHFRSYTKASGCIRKTNKLMNLQATNIFNRMKT